MRGVIPQQLDCPRHGPRTGSSVGIIERSRQVVRLAKQEAMQKHLLEAANSEREREGSAWAAGDLIDETDRLRHGLPSRGGEVEGHVELNGLGYRRIQQKFQFGLQVASRDHDGDLRELFAAVELHRSPRHEHPGSLFRTVHG